MGCAAKTGTTRSARPRPSTRPTGSAAVSDVPERPGRVRGSTRSVGVLGWPVDHTLSPVIHNAAFPALGLDGSSVPRPSPPAELPAALGGLVALGFAGANVTMPHKTPTAELIDDLSEDARLLRAVNTIVVGADGLAGHNSDAAGFERFLRDDVGFDASGRSALLFGAGGGARACALATARSGAGGPPAGGGGRGGGVRLPPRRVGASDPLRRGARGVAGRRPARGARELGHRRARRRLRRRPGGRGRPDRQRGAARRAGGGR